MKASRVFSTDEEKQAAKEYAAHVIALELQKDKFTDVEELEDTIIDSFLAGCVWKRHTDNLAMGMVPVSNGLTTSNDGINVMPI